MAIDYVRNIISSGYNLAKINDNFAKIEDALVDAVSRSGTGPNQMEADLDLNSNDLLNVNQIDAERFVLNGVEVGTSEVPLVILDEILEARDDAEIARALAQAWAEGTLPGGPGTKSSKEWAEEAEAFVGISQISVNSIAELKALDTSKYTLAYLKLGKRSGVFAWTTGNYSALVTADTVGGYVIKADAQNAATGAWVRQGVVQNRLDPFWFGAVGTGKPTSDSAAVQVASDVLTLLGGGMIAFGVGTFYMTSQVTLAGGTFVSGCYHQTRIYRDTDYGNTFVYPTGGFAKVYGLYFDHGNWDQVASPTSLPDKATGVTAHVKLVDTQWADIYDNIFFRMPYGVISDGGHNSHVFRNFFSGVYDPLNVGLQEGLSSLAFLGTNRYGQLGRVNENYFAGRAATGRTLTYTDSNGRTVTSPNTIANIGPRDAIEVASCEDLEIKGNYVGRSSRSLINISANATYPFIVNIRVIANFLDNCGTVTEGAQIRVRSEKATGGLGLGLTITGNQFNGQYDTLHAIDIFERLGGGISLTNLQIVGNGFYCHVASPIRIFGATKGNISGNTLHNWNSLNVTLTSPSDPAYSTGIILDGVTSGVMINGNTLGGGGNDGLTSGANYSYYGIIITATPLTTCQSFGNLDAGVLNGVDVWQSYTPTVTAESGTLTTVSSTGFYKLEGKICHVRIQVNLTTLGTGAGALIATLPKTGKPSTIQVLTGINSSTANTLSGIITSADATRVAVRLYNASAPLANGQVAVVEGSYETV